jgi:hypothetical protein
MYGNVLKPMLNDAIAAAAASYHGPLMLQYNLDE